MEDLWDLPKFMVVKCIMFTYVISVIVINTVRRNKTLVSLQYKLQDAEYYYYRYYTHCVLDENFVTNESNI